MKLYVLLMFLAARLTDVYSSDFKLLLLHNNDIHARFEEMFKNMASCRSDNRNLSCYGGIARTAHLIRQARKAAADGTRPNVIYLNGGNTYTGSAWFSLDKYKLVADFLNLLAPDVMSFGNHEFDFGIEGLVSLVETVNFPIVASNLDFKLEPKLANGKVKKSITLIRSGHKIGIIGYLTNKAKSIASTGDVIFLDEVDSIKKESERLDKEGVKIIFAIGHSCFETDKKIAQYVPLVDVVIGGHTNAFLYNESQPKLEDVEGLYPTLITQISGKKVPVIQAYANMKYLGCLNISFNDKGDLVEFADKPISITPDIVQDQEVHALLDKYRPRVEALEMDILGSTKTFLDSRSCRQEECVFGNFVTDALIKYGMANYNGAPWTNVPIAIWNSGGIRKHISIGNISYADLVNSFPFNLTVYRLFLKGNDLLDVLEHSLHSNGETSSGEFLQVSGLRILYNPVKPSRMRVEKAQVRCGECRVPKYRDLDINKTYGLMVSSFLVGGGDGFSVLKEKSFNKSLEKLSAVDIFAWYVKKMTPIYAEITGRNKIYINCENQDLFGFKVSSNPIILTAFSLYNLYILQTILFVIH